MNPRDNEREFGAMLKRGLASGPAAAESEHLDAEVLAAYFERTLTADEIRACDLHVSNCAHCRSELAALARAEPESHEVSGSRSFAWLWDWRFLVPVTAAVAMFIAFATVRRSVPIAGWARSSAYCRAESGAGCCASGAAAEF